MHRCSARSLGRRVGAYTVQAAISACQAQALTVEETDWQHLVELYRAFADISPTPVVRLNLAVVVGMASGSAGGADAR